MCRFGGRCVTSVTDHVVLAQKTRATIRSLLLHVVLPIFLLGSLVSYLAFIDYVETDPAFCGTCHQTRDEYTLWTQSEHKGLVCQDCHHQSEEEALRLLFAFVLQGESVKRPKSKNSSHRPEVPINACVQCHMTHDRRWPQVGQSTGHKVHLAAEGTSCLDCHARSIHKFGATIDACKECHGPHTLKTAGMEDLHCLACHDFLTADENVNPPQRICLGCHRKNGLMEPVIPANAPMTNLDCWACHRPHEESGPGVVVCTECHENMSRHGLHHQSGHGLCGDCHAAHRWTSTRRQCTACHRDMVSHNGHMQCRDCHSFTRRPAQAGDEP